ncbi:minor capsid protein [Streptomyces sp. NPDC057651]|uniref:minor capsid protein n=1 Tax=Streptomyces sp. NPDC057651 TaxID=3346194 RepID=UPI0036A6D963
MSFLVDLVDGLARLLDAQAVGVYRPDGLYADGETAITDTAMPPGPDRAVVLTVYADAGSAALTDTTVSVQVRTRAGQDPRDVADLDDAAYTVLHAAGPLNVGGIPVNLIYRTSTASLGADANGRHERTSNYSVRTHRAHPQLS